MVWTRTTARIAGAGALTLALAAALIGCWVLFDPSGLGCDFVPLRHAATALVHGQNVYGDPGFVYPPSAAFLLAPTALGTMQHAWTAWLVVSVLALTASATLIVRNAVAGRKVALASAAIGLLFGGSLADDSLWLGNMSVVLLPLAVGAAFCFTRGRWTRGTALLAFSLLLKPLFAPLLLVPVLRSRWRTVVTVLAPTGVLVLVCCLVVPGGGDLPRILAYCLKATNLHGANAVHNLSLHGWAEARHLPAWTADVVALVVGSFAAVALLARRPDVDVAVDAGIVLATAFLAGPICESHYLLATGAIALLVLGRSVRLRADVLALVPGLAMLTTPSPVRDLLCGSALDRQTCYLVAQALLLGGLCLVRLTHRTTTTRPEEAAVPEPVLVAV